MSDVTSVTLPDAVEVETDGGQLVLIRRDSIDAAYWDGSTLVLWIRCGRQVRLRGDYGHFLPGLWGDAAFIMGVHQLQMRPHTLNGERARLAEAAKPK